MQAGLDIDSVLRALGGLPPEELQQTIAQAQQLVGRRRWVPNPGPQTAAVFSEADELFYGGQAGGGKTDLEIGLALTEHERSLLLRRTNKEANGLVERIAGILGSRDGWNGQDDVWRLPGGRVIDVGGCQQEEDKQKYKGIPHDLICFDEVSDFTESQYLFISTWNRSARPGQRCRVVAAGNPPTRPEGLWVLRRWAAWLDPTHPNPAAPGELRWYVRLADDTEREVPGPGEYLFEGEEKPLAAKSRTFIPARLDDNPDLRDTSYRAMLDSLPAELRMAYRDGKFDAGLKDAQFQIIPTAWIRLAQQRWTPQPPAGVPMCCIAADASGGGTDPMVVARRYDGWFAPMLVVPGKDIPIESAGAHCGGIILQHRRDGAEIVIDMSGGYGSSMYEHLHNNGLRPHAYKGAEAASGASNEGQFSFANKRTRALWRFREALNPEQPGGSPIMLPNSPTMVADLTAPTYQVKGRVIHAEAKEVVCKRLGRSTDEGDAVVMCYSRGLKQENVAGGFAGMYQSRTPAVLLGHDSARRRRH